MDAGGLAPTTEDCVKLTQSARILTLLKENRIEMMIATILLYSTGLLEKAVTYGTGVCA
jgi:hypothetical protein